MTSNATPKLTDVYIFNSTQLETFKCPYQWNGYINCGIYIELPHSKENEKNVATYNMDKSHKRAFGWKKIDTKEYKRYDYIYTQLYKV